MKSEMKFYQPQSKNILTLIAMASVATLALVVDLILNKNGYGLDSHQANTSPYLQALQPMVFGGLPILLMVSFILSLFTIGREETRLGRYQAVALLLIILIFGYLTSYLMFAGAGLSD